MAWIRRGLLVLLIGASLAWVAAAPEPAPKAAVLNVEGPIGPATTAYVLRGFERAAALDARVIVLRLDTPGGLSEAMRDLVQAILGSPIPVAVYVAPSGARAASAGTYLLYAAHVAAMAPGTNLGAATPVQIGAPPGGGGDQPAGDRDPVNGETAPDPGDGDTLTRKAVNDAVAYLRSLAELRGRNADWAERAVRESASLSARAALERDVIDLMAEDVPGLLQQIDGRRVTTAAGPVVLQTAQARPVAVEPTWRDRFLAAITHPNVAYILMLVGIYGLLMEILSPGLIFPGVLGGISLLLALYAFQALPISWTGLGLILVGVGLITAEAFAPSFGILGLGGVAAFVLGSLMLFDTGVPGYDVALPLVLGVAAFSALFLLGVVALVLRARGRPQTAGQAGLIGATAVAQEAFAESGWVHVHGERWRARSATPVRAGERLRVVAVDGLTLQVEPLPTVGEP